MTIIIKSVVRDLQTLVCFLWFITGVGKKVGENKDVRRPCSPVVVFLSSMSTGVDHARRAMPHFVSPLVTPARVVVTVPWGQ